MPQLYIPFLSGTIILETYPKGWPRSISVSVPIDGTTEGTEVVWPGRKQAWWRMARGGTGMLILDKKKKGRLELLCDHPVQAAEDISNK